MKIICVGRNYSEHITELKNERPEEPVIFLKPSTALIVEPETVQHLSPVMELHHEVEVVYRIGKEGSHIDEKDAHTYMDAVSLGIDFTDRAKQAWLKSKGLPWELAKSFDGSAVVGMMRPFEGFGKGEFRLDIDGRTVQKGSVSDMLFPVQELIAFVSKYFRLEEGDLLYTGTPAGVGKVENGNRLDGYLDGTKAFSFTVT